ncbi:MAG: hypothetical protein QXX94_03105 [Candidatus Bathyarchaeia archaeon]
MLGERRRRKSLTIDKFLTTLFLTNLKDYLMSSRGGFAGGYSISVIQTPEGTKVKAKVGGNVDVNMLRKRLEQQCLGAEI